MSYNKKYNSYTNSGKCDKNRNLVSNVFVSECSVESTPSPSRLSLSSLIYNESSTTNDSESFASQFSLQVLKEKFDELTKKRKELKNLLDQKTKEAIELNKKEFTLTCKIPADHKLLDPLHEVCFTKNPIPSCLLNDDDKSVYQNEKKLLLLQFETLTNITKVLSKLPKTEKKMKRDLEKKRKEIETIKEKLNDLEKHHASEISNLKARSSSVGNLNRISIKQNELSLSNGYLTDRRMNLDSNDSCEIPLTEPSQRKFKALENTLILASYSNRENKESRTRNDSNTTVCTSPRYKFTHHNQKSNGNSLSPNSQNPINSTFQRFASARTTIKGPAMSEKVRSSFNKYEKSNIFEDAYNSNISSTSHSSIDETTSSDISDMQEPYIQKIPSEPLVNKFITLRPTSTVSCRVHNCRDSVELNHYRLNHSDSNQSGKIPSRYNKQNRKSVSLEDLREENITPNVTYLAHKESHNISESLNSYIRSQLKYHPSTKDLQRPNSITKGRQPSIIRKEARNNSIDKMS